MASACVWGRKENGAGHPKQEGWKEDDGLQGQVGCWQRKQGWVDKRINGVFGLERRGSNNEPGPSSLNQQARLSFPAQLHMCRCPSVVSYSAIASARARRTRLAHERKSARQAPRTRILPGVRSKAREHSTAQFYEGYVTAWRPSISTDIAFCTEPRTKLL
jgi:hypothetical protein